jgi:thiaminase
VLLDAEYTDADRARTGDAFDRSARYELAFWEMAYTKGRSDHSRGADSSGRQ